MRGGVGRLVAAVIPASIGTRRHRIDGGRVTAAEAAVRTSDLGDPDEFRKVDDIR